MLIKRGFGEIVIGIKIPKEAVTDENMKKNVHKIILKWVPRELKINRKLDRVDDSYQC